MQGCLLLYITNLSTDITDRTIENSSIHYKPQLLATKQTYLSKGPFPVVSLDFLALRLFQRADHCRLLLREAGIVALNLQGGLQQLMAVSADSRASRALPALT